MLEKMGGFFKVGMTGSIHFPFGTYFPHDIIIFPLGYKIEKKIHNSHVVFFSA